MPETQEVIDALQIVCSLAAAELDDNTEDVTEDEHAKQEAALELVRVHLAELKQSLKPSKESSEGEDE